MIARRLLPVGDEHVILAATLAGESDSLSVNTTFLAVLLLLLL